MGSTWRNLFIQNSRGQKLAVLLCQAVAGEKAFQQPVVIVCHGFTGSKEGSGRALEMGEALAGRGFNTLLFDFTGCGESEGRWEKITLSGHIEDLNCVVQWCRAGGFREVILNGRSFGGAAVLCCAARDRRIAGVSTWAAPANLVELFGGFAGEAVAGSPEAVVTLHDETGKVNVHKGFFFDLARHHITACAAAVTPRPLLVIHGEADETVPLADAAAIYADAGEPKQLAVIEGADHRFSGHIATVWETFFRWLERFK